MNDDTITALAQALRTVTSEPITVPANLELEFEEEVQQVLEQEEKSKQQTRKKRFRPHSITYSLTQEQLYIHRMRLKARRDYESKSIAQFLAENPDYMMITGGSYSLDFWFIDPQSEDKVVRSKTLLFDADLNIITSIEGQRTVFSESERYNIYSLVTDSYFILNVRKLIESRGKEFRVAWKKNYSKYSMIDVKRLLYNQIQRGRNVLDTVDRWMSGIFEKSHYDIIIKIIASDSVRYYVTLKNEDITIRNSIELEKYLGTIYATFHGYYDGTSIYLKDHMYGIRTTYSVRDVIFGYTHSHLPGQCAKTRESFCLGHEDNFFHHLRNVALDEISFQSAVMGIPDYLRWESLEGGPYYKMEQIGVRGQEYQLSRFDMNTGSNYSISEKRDMLKLFIKNKQELKRIFKLSKQAEGYKFTYPTDQLFEFVGRKIAEDENKYPFLALSYQVAPDTGKIYSNKLQTMDWDTTVGKAQDEIAEYRPVYFKGQEIKPELIVEDDHKLFDFELLPLPTPTLVMMAANAFCQLLNNELKKDEYTKRQ